MTLSSEDSVSPGRRDLFRATAGVLAFAITPSLLAQSWPAKPLRMILTVPPGSSIDVLGRHA